MKRYPAIALLEISSIAQGVLTGDAMAKKAPIDMLRSGTVQPGKYLVLIGGSVGDVEEAFREGERLAAERLIDRVFLPDVHPQVHDAVLGSRHTELRDALGVIETSTVAAVVHAADAGIKGADVHVIEVRLADGMGGKGIVLFTGRVADVQAAVEAGTGVLGGHDCTVCETVIPALHEEMVRDVSETTRFFGAQ